MRPSHGMTFTAGLFAMAAAQHMSVVWAWAAIGMGALACWAAIWDA